MLVNYVKKVYFPVGVLEYISTNLLKIAVKKLNLSINFVKNELLHNRLLRILRAIQYLWNPPCVILWNLTFSLLVIALVKCTSCFSYPLVQKIRIAYSLSIFNFIIISYFLRVKDLKNTFETTLSCNVGEVHKTILLINTAYLGPIQGLRGSC